MSIPKKAPTRVPSGRVGVEDGAVVAGRATASVGDEGLPHRLTFLLNRIVSVLIDGSASQFRSLGLSIPAARALITLYECGAEMTVGSVAKMTSVDLSTMSHILRRLEAQGLVSRERHALDNRVVHATLTDAGRVIGKQCRKASLQHERLLLGDISYTDEAQLKKLLMRVYENATVGFGG